MCLAIGIEFFSTEFLFQRLNEAPIIMSVSFLFQAQMRVRNIDVVSTVVTWTIAAYVNVRMDSQDLHVNASKMVRTADEYLSS